MKTTKDKVRAAFRALRRRGYLARMNFMCCNNCGHAALTDEASAMAKNQNYILGYVFWCSQSNDAWEKEELVDPLYLQWSDVEDRSTEIVRAFREAGLKVSHRGGIKKSIRLAATAMRSTERIKKDAELAEFWVGVREAGRRARLTDDPAKWIH